MDSRFKFQWARDAAGYHAEYRKPGGDYIVRNGGELAPYAPDDSVRPLHHQIAALHDSPRGAEPIAACLAFIEANGFLGLDPAGPAAQAESVERILEQARNLSVIVEFGLQAGPGSPTTRANVAAAINTRMPSTSIQLVKGRAGLYRIEVVPKSLISWAWIRCAQEFAKELEWRDCVRRECGNGFFVGAYHRTVRAQYCSPVCKAIDHRSQKGG